MTARTSSAAIRTLQGTHGFAENVNSPPIVGGVWCDKTGTLWYLQAHPASGNLPIMTTMIFEAGTAGTTPQDRYLKFEPVVPSS